jgi:hypothetical protein
MRKVPMPTDELTGIPLLLAPEERALSILYDCEPSHDEAGQPVGDWDHAWFEAKNIVHGGFGGPALRGSRVQFVVRDTQHEEKNGIFGEPRQLPRDPLERFTATALCAAGYIPPQAISFNSAGYSLSDLSGWNIVRLRESGELRVASEPTVQKFFTEFLLSRPLEVRTPIIDTFLALDPFASADDARKQKEIACDLLSLVISSIGKPLVRPYAIAYEKGLLLPDAPPDPGIFLQNNIIRSRKNMRTIIGEFIGRLTALREGTAIVAPQVGSLALSTA